MLFFKKRPEKRVLGKGFIPRDKVKELSSQGFTEMQIISALKREGFSASEIDGALTQVLRAGIAEERGEMPQPEPAETGGLPTLEDITRTERVEMPAVPETSLPEEYKQPEQYNTEEYVSMVVGERMQDVESKIADFSVKYGELEGRLQQIHGQLSVLATGEPTERELIATKLDSLKDTIDDVSVRLNAFERAFKETLPALIESVRALSDLVQRFKTEA